MPETPSLVSVWAIVTTLVVFGIVFKRGQAALLRRVPTLGAGLVQTMFQELTLLGALGLLLFTVEEAGMLQGLSEALFGDTTTLPALVRGVDLVRGDASWRVWLWPASGRRALLCASATSPSRTAAASVPSRGACTRANRNGPVGTTPVVLGWVYGLAPRVAVRLRVCHACVAIDRCCHAHVCTSCALCGRHRCWSALSSRSC